MEYGQHGNCTVEHCIGSDVLGAGYYELSRSRNAAYSAQLREVGKPGDRAHDSLVLPLRSRQVVSGNEIESRRQMHQCLGAPDELHALLGLGPASTLSDHPENLFVGDGLPRLYLPETLADQLAVIVVEREILVNSLVEHKAAVALLDLGERVKGLEALFGNTEGNCLQGHALRIRENAKEYQTRREPHWIL